MIIEIGRLAKTVEIKMIHTDKGDFKVVNNCLAINSNKNETVFIDITAWNKMAEFICNNFQKGDEIYIEGTLKNKNYKDSDKPIKNPYILIENIKFTHGKANL